MDQHNRHAESENERQARAADKARNATLRAAIMVCLEEQIIDPDNDDDVTYNRAIDHCVEAITGLTTDRS